MNSKGQVLVLFMLLLPLVFMMLALIIDTGLLYIEKRHVDLVVKDTTEYGIKTINSVTEEELASHGVNIVIYANQLTRSAFPAMQATAEEILRSHRALEVDSKLMPFKEIITLIDEL